MGLVKACLIVLQCLANNGIDPDYLHSFNRDEQGVVKVIWDSAGTVYLERLQFCVPPDKKKPVRCEYHTDPDKEWVNP